MLTIMFYTIWLVFFNQFYIVFAVCCDVDTFEVDVAGGISSVLTRWLCRWLMHLP